MALLNRDADVRYLTGMPNDSLLFITENGKSILVPWDSILADKLAVADEVVPYTEHGRNLQYAIEGVINREKLPAGARIELPADTPYPVYAKLAQELPDSALLCRSDGIESVVKKHRAVKDPQELSQLKRAAAITNDILQLLQERFFLKQPSSEVDLALFLERESRSRGADGTGFTPIVAGPSRSFGIHAFPSYTAGNLQLPGLTIVDFGVNIEGYCSDVTLTVVRGKTSELQERMIALVQKAYDLAISMIKPGVQTYEISQAVDGLFADNGFLMPHSLGHGVGLEVHEAPMLRSSKTDSSELEAGMVLTIEPGLYDPEAGGVRLENTFLVTQAGGNALTSCRILRYLD